MIFLANFLNFFDIIQLQRQIEIMKNHKCILYGNSFCHEIFYIHRYTLRVVLHLSLTMPKPLMQIVMLCAWKMPLRERNEILSLLVGFHSSVLPASRLNSSTMNSMNYLSTFRFPTKMLLRSCNAAINTLWRTERI